jgi:5'-AMP-activated protein kinase catalytic alpha subunit
LLTNDNQILKIIDFGLSNTYKKGQLLKTGCGSPCYVPPEMIKEEGYNGALADIWSAGVILYLMLCGNLPFYHDDNQILYEKILAGKYDTPSHLSENAKDLLSKILEIDPKKRINFEGIKSHPWFSIIDKKYLMNKGIIVNEDIFPIDEEILQDMEKMGFNKVEIRYNIIKNYHNKITTTYDLLLKKKVNMGKKSIADLNSDLYNKYINDSNNKISHYGNLDNVLKNRIGDDGKPVSTIPDWPENKYDDNNENIIKGDSGSVIERLIKSGRFTFDEENMCVNRAKPALRKQISNDSESRFKTISSMQPSKKKFEKISDKENERKSPDVNKIKRNKVHFEEENKSKKKEEDEDWFKEMEETIDKEIENTKVLRENKTSNLHKTKKKIPQMLTGNDSGNLEEGKKSLKNPKNGYKSSKNIKIGAAESSSKKVTSKFSTNPNAKSMKALKKKNTFEDEENNTKNKSNAKIKNPNHIIKKTDGVRPKSGQRKETSVEKIDRGSKKGGKVKKIVGEIEEAIARGNLRRNQSCERRFNKIKI